MALKAGNVPDFCNNLFIIPLLFLAALLPAQSPSPQPNAFDDQAASQMLLQMSEALEGHSQKQFLALFNLDKMQDGQIFKQQVSSFFSQTESIRVHMNLLEVTAEGGNATLSVAAEIEAEPRNGNPVVHQSEQITFTADSASKWKFIDVKPRGFFSLP